MSFGSCPLGKSYFHRLHSQQHIYLICIVHRLFSDPIFIRESVHDTVSAKNHPLYHVLVCFGTTPEVIYISLFHKICQYHQIRNTKICVGNKKNGITVWLQVKYYYNTYTCLMDVGRVKWNEKIRAMFHSSLPTKHHTTSVVLFFCS